MFKLLADRWFSILGLAIVLLALQSSIELQADDSSPQTALTYENTQRLQQMGSDYYSLSNPYYSADKVPAGKRNGYNNMIGNFDDTVVPEETNDTTGQ